MDKIFLSVCITVDIIEIYITALLALVIPLFCFQIEKDEKRRKLRGVFRLPINCFIY